MERKPLSSPLSGFLIYAIRHRGDAYEDFLRVVSFRGKMKERKVTKKI